MAQTFGIRHLLVHVIKTTNTVSAKTIRYLCLTWATNAIPLTQTQLIAISNYTTTTLSWYWMWKLTSTITINDTADILELTDNALKLNVEYTGIPGTLTFKHPWENHFIAIACILGLLYACKKDIDDIQPAPCRHYTWEDFSTQLDHHPIRHSTATMFLVWLFLPANKTTPIDFTKTVWWANTRMPMYV